MASECPLKILTQSPERLSQILTFPSTQPAAMYLEAPSHDKHVTPSCSQGYKNMRLWWETDRQFNFWKVFYYYFLCETVLRQTSLSHVQRGDECCRSQKMSLLSMLPVAAHGGLPCKTSHDHVYVNYKKKDLT